MKRTAMFNGLVVAAIAVPVLMVAVIATSGPARLTRAVLPAADTVIAADPLVAAAEAGELERYIRQASHDSDSIYPYMRSDQQMHIGDRITIAAHDGSKRLYAVRAIQALPIPIRKSARNLESSTHRLLLVTCADTSDPNARPLRIIVEQHTAPGFTTSTADAPQAL